MARDKKSKLQHAVELQEGNNLNMSEVINHREYDFNLTSGRDYLTYRKRMILESGKSSRIINGRVYAPVSTVHFLIDDDQGKSVWIPYNLFNQFKD